VNVEYTGRHFEITPAIKKNVETGLHKIKKILGGAFEASVVLALEKHRHKAEITITPRNGTIVGASESTEMTVAVGEALEHLEKQALKHRARSRTKKRHPRAGSANGTKDWSAATDVPRSGSQDDQALAGIVAAGKNGATVPLVVHKFQAKSKMSEVHVVPATDSVAMRPMTLEEAVKEAHFRDRDVFVFRDRKGRVKILHRTRDGKMELIEAP
jgi:putative sigma-54 modulation protein